MICIFSDDISVVLSRVSLTIAGSSRTFDWSTYLSQSGAPTASVTCFKHVSLATQLTTLETRKLREDQIEVFKTLNGYEKIDRNIFSSVKEERRTRGHGVTLAKKQCRLDIIIFYKEQ